MGGYRNLRIGGVGDAGPFETTGGTYIDVMRKIKISVPIYAITEGAFMFSSGSVKVQKQLFLRHFMTKMKNPHPPFDGEVGMVERLSYINYAAKADFLSAREGRRCSFDTDHDRSALIDSNDHLLLLRPCEDTFRGKGFIGGRLLEGQLVSGEP